MAKQRIFFNALYNLRVFPLVNPHISLHKKMKFFTKDFFSKCGQIRSFSEEILRRKLHFLCSVHAMDPWGPNHYVFGDQSYSKNARKLPLYAGKHMIPWFYLKWTEFAKTCELCSNLNRVLEDPKLKQYSQYALSYVF